MCGKSVSDFRRGDVPKFDACRTRRAVHVAEFGSNLQIRVGQDRAFLIVRMVVAAGVCLTKFVKLLEGGEAWTLARNMQRSRPQSSPGPVGTDRSHRAVEWWPLALDL